MIKKVVLIIVVSLLALAFLLYNFIYSPLVEEEAELILELAQKINRLEELETDISNLADIEDEYESILKALEHEYPTQLSSSSKINNLIIELSSSDLVVDMDSSLGDNLRVELELLGNYEEIYNFFKEIDYIYDTASLKIRKETEKINLKSTLLFSLERGE